MIRLKTIILSILFFLLLGLGIYSIYLIRISTDIDISLPSKEYIFRVEGLNNKIVRDLFFFYDFEEEKGFFRFRTGGHGEIKDLDVNIPVEFNQTDVIIFNSSNGKELNLTEDKFSEYTPAGVSIREIGDENIEILINLTNRNNSFYPNGRFIFSFDTNSEVTLNDEEVDGYYGSLLKFNFGNKYRCSENCFILEEVTNKSVMALPNQNQLLITTKTNSENIGRRIIFNIGTYNFQQKEKANFNLNMGIALFSSAAVGLISYLLTILLQNKKIKKIKKKSK